VSKPTKEELFDWLNAKTNITLRKEFGGFWPHHWVITQNIDGRIETVADKDLEQGLRRAQIVEEFYGR
jgi:hypothetical protein